jgi:2-C-methyl-D-erythritol 4-phosphate cytidylyltransferase
MNVAIIVAAGRGARAGAGAVKQFRELGGVPVVVHALRRFEECASVGETCLVLPAADAAHLAGLAGQYGLRKLARVVAGGASRTESVWRGLQTVDGATAGVVAIHDGVRPLVTPAEIDATVRAAEATGAAVLVAPVTDTIKEVGGGLIKSTPARENLRRALTPQCFRYDLLRRAYERALAAGLDATDDSALVELLGVAVAAVEGDARNLKLTRPEDFALAEILLRESGRG